MHEIKARSMQVFDSLCLNKKGYSHFVHIKWTTEIWLDFFEFDKQKREQREQHYSFIVITKHLID